MKLYPYIKRTVDLLAGISLLVVLFPFILLVLLAVSLLTGEPPLFFQQRIGWKEQGFRIVKVKTIYQKPTNANKFFGGLLRKYGIDELPQLIHVIAGQMSVVGPRPLLPEYLPQYTTKERRRHDVRPGLTGLVQVSGRNQLTWHDKLQLDVEYVRRLSFKLDVKILLQTVALLLSGATDGREGIKFSGNGKEIFNDIDIQK